MQRRKKGKREKKIVRKRCSRHFYFPIKVMETGIYFYCPACTQAFPRSSSRGMMSVRGGWDGLGWSGDSGLNRSSVPFARYSLHGSHNRYSRGFVAANRPECASFFPFLAPFQNERYLATLGPPSVRSEEIIQRCMMYI